MTEKKLQRLLGSIDSMIQDPDVLRVVSERITEIHLSIYKK